MVIKNHREFVSRALENSALNDKELKTSMILERENYLILMLPGRRRRRESYDVNKWCQAYNY